MLVTLSAKLVDARKGTVLVMPTEKDIQFLQFIYDQTKDRKIHWEATADESKFVVAFKGKYKVTVDRAWDNEREETYYYLTLVDDTEKELLKIWDEDGKLVRDLFSLAQRDALNVDAAIDEIMGDRKSGSSPISDEDIPF
jgi:hypothetical protein